MHTYFLACFHNWGALYTIIVAAQFAAIKNCPILLPIILIIIIITNKMEKKRTAKFFALSYFLFFLWSVAPSSVNAQFMYDCLPPGRYFASAPAGPPPVPLPPPPPAIMASPPAIAVGCAPVAQPMPVFAAPPPPPPLAAPLLRSPAGFMPAAAVPAFAPAAAFPGIMPAAAFPGLTAAAAVPALTPAAAFPGLLPTYSPAVAVPAAPLLRMPPAMCGFPRKAAAKVMAHKKFATRKGRRAMADTPLEQRH